MLYWCRETPNDVSAIGACFRCWSLCYWWTHSWHWVWEAVAWELLPFLPRYSYRDVLCRKSVKLHIVSTFGPISYKTRDTHWRNLGKCTINQQVYLRIGALTIFFEFQEGRQLRVLPWLVWVWCLALKMVLSCYQRMERNGRTTPSY